MTTPRPLAHGQWGPFFDFMSDALLGKRAEIEAASLELGDQIVAERLPVLGVTYDHHDDLLDVALVGFDHLILHPRQIFVQEAAGGLETITVESSDGVKWVLRLRDPLMLPPAEKELAEPARSR